MYEEAKYFNMDEDDSEDNDYKDDSGQEAAEEAACQRCGERGDETYVALCQPCQQTFCILCESPKQCRTCLTNMCETCYIRHACNKERPEKKQQEAGSKSIVPPINQDMPNGQGEQHEVHPTSASSTTLHAENINIHSVHNNSSFRKLDLDDPEADPVEEEADQEERECEPAGFEGSLSSSGSSSSNSSHVVTNPGQKRRRLNEKTDSKNTVYGEVRVKRKMSMNSEDINRAVTSTKRIRINEFEDTLNKQST